MEVDGLDYLVYTPSSQKIIWSAKQELKNSNILLSKKIRIICINWKNSSISSNLQVRPICFFYDLFNPKKRNLRVQHGPYSS